MVFALLVCPLVASAGDPVKSRADFDKTIKLYNMTDALKVSEETGKPVICWMGKGLFDNETARKLSVALKDTTIQAAMDDDNSKFDTIKGPRLKFSVGTYDGADTYCVPLSRLHEPGIDTKILKALRGGEVKAREIK